MAPHDGFPLFKLATLLARQISSPIATRIKKFAMENPLFSQLVCARTAEARGVARARICAAGGTRTTCARRALDAQSPAPSLTPGRARERRRSTCFVAVLLKLNLSDFCITEYLAMYGFALWKMFDLLWEEFVGHEEEQTTHCSASNLPTEAINFMCMKIQKRATWAQLLHLLDESRESLEQHQRLIDEMRERLQGATADTARESHPEAPAAPASPRTDGNNEEHTINHPENIFYMP